MYPGNFKVGIIQSNKNIINTPMVIFRSGYIILIPSDHCVCRLSCCRNCNTVFIPVGKLRIISSIRVPILYCIPCRTIISRVLNVNTFIGKVRAFTWRSFGLNRIAHFKTNHPSLTEIKRNSFHTSGVYRCVSHPHKWRAIRRRDSTCVVGNSNSLSKLPSNRRPGVKIFLKGNISCSVSEC